MTSHRNRNRRRTSRTYPGTNTALALNRPMVEHLLGNPGVPLSLRIVFLSALRCDEDGVATFAPGELLGLLTLEHDRRGGPTPEILERAIAFNRRTGVAGATSTSEVIYLNLSEVMAFPAEETAR